MQTKAGKQHHLLVRPFGHTHHEEKQPREADPLHGGDEEKCVGLGVGRPHRHGRHLRQGQGAQVGCVQALAQAETEGQQRQCGRHQAAKRQVAQTLLHQLHLRTPRKQRSEASSRLITRPPQATSSGDMAPSERVKFVRRLGVQRGAAIALCHLGAHFKKLITNFICWFVFFNQCRYLDLEAWQATFKTAARQARRANVE